MSHAVSLVAGLRWDFEPVSLASSWTCLAKAAHSQAREAHGATEHNPSFVPARTHYESSHVSYVRALVMIVATTKGCIKKPAQGRLDRTLEE